MTTATADSQAAIRSFLARAGLIAPGETPAMAGLTGGVSSDIWRVELPGGYQALFTDTVGFIQKLPTTLVEAFHATLEEIGESDLLLHVVDISHPNALNQYEAVQQTLDELGADHIPTITVLNKIDQLRDPHAAQGIVGRLPDRRLPHRDRLPRVGWPVRRRRDLHRRRGGLPGGRLRRRRRDLPRDERHL